MKILQLSIISVVIVVFLTAGYIFRSRLLESPVTQKISDICPKEKRLPVEKIPARIQPGRYKTTVEHDVYNFSFVMPSEGFRYEQNTLQDFEEPISLPLYLFTMLLTYGQTRIENRLAPYEIRFFVYPTWCNTESDWAKFLQIQGWNILPKEDGLPLFIRMEKIQSGRIYRRYFVHRNSRHYEFEESWDTVFAKTVAAEKAREILESFVFTKKEDK